MKLIHADTILWTSYLVASCNRGSYLHRFGETATSRSISHFSAITELH